MREHNVIPSTQEMKCKWNSIRTPNSRTGRINNNHWESVGVMVLCKESDTSEQFPHAGGRDSPLLRMAANAFLDFGGWKS